MQCRSIQIRVIARPACPDLLLHAAQSDAEDMFWQIKQDFMQSAMPFSRTSCGLTCLAERLRDHLQVREAGWRSQQAG